METVVLFSNRIIYCFYDKKITAKRKAKETWGAPSVGTQCFPKKSDNESVAREPCQDIFIPKHGC